MSNSVDKFGRMRREDFKRELSEEVQDTRVRRGSAVDDERTSRYRQPSTEVRPTKKRPRSDWDESTHYQQQPRYQVLPSPARNQYARENNNRITDGASQPMPFRSWLLTQTDSLNETEAMGKYDEYKIGFKSKQTSDFFEAHREEEWFKNKYHPEESSKQKQEKQAKIDKRNEMFMRLMREGYFDEVTLDVRNSEKVIQLMDYYVTRLESEKNQSETPIPTQHQQDIKSAETSELKTEAEGQSDSGDTEIGRAKNREIAFEEKKGNAQGLRNGPSSSRDTENDEEKQACVTNSDSKPQSKSSVNNSRKRGRKEDSDSDFGSGSESEDGEVENKEISPNTEPRDQISVKQKTTKVSQLNPPSIYLRSIAASVTKREVESVFKKFPGFLRVAFSEPQADRNWLRRGWVTFQENVNVKEICDSLANVRLRDTLLCPVVSSPLSRRVRSVSGITMHSSIVTNDIRLAAKAIYLLDAKANLWGEEPEESGVQRQSYGVYSINPVLRNVTDFMIEVDSTEEDELMRSSRPNENEEKPEIADEKCMKVLDRMLFYLRFVHSVDYYDHKEYLDEDDMPNRLGIMHARGVPSTSRVAFSEWIDYNTNFEQQSSSAEFLQPQVPLSDEDCIPLGMKTENKEVENFILANTQELGADKWLCPLSGKKFKAPEFVRKHIMTKFAEKLVDARKSVEYYNNFLRDPRRPHLKQTGRPEPTNSMQRREREQPLTEEGFNRIQKPSLNHPQSFHMRRGEPKELGLTNGSRTVVGYNDVDAPSESNIF